MAKFSAPKCFVCHKTKQAASLTALEKGDYACGCNSLDYSLHKELRKNFLDKNPVTLDLQDYEVIKFVVLGNPAIKKNSQRIVMNGIRPSKLFEVWASRALLQIGHQWTKMERPTISGPVHLEAHFYRETKKESDLSNLYEGIQDCLTVMGVWLDDSQIESHDGSRKHYDKKNPRIEVILRKF